MSHWSSPAAVAVADPLWRALAVLRVILLLNTAGVSAYHADSYERPGAVAVALGVMALWTAVATWAYAAPRRRTPPLLVGDLALALALLAATPWVKGPDFAISLPSFWVAGALCAWAIHWQWLGGLVSGVLLAATDITLRSRIDQSDYGNAFLLVIGGTIIGFMCGSLRRMAVERDAALHRAAVEAERTRLARAVHDGVLQVLALVQRRGTALGGEGAELGRLAGEQERQLRALIREQDTVETSDPTSRAASSPARQTVDLASALTRLQSATVTVSTPGFPVELPAAVADELLAAVRACLDNVRVHVGEDAPAWVLLQAFPDRVEVGVRDDGPGIPAGRLDEAAAQGRLGVVASIRGRVDDLGGTAELSTGSFGTEWELVVPRAALESGA